MIWKHRLGSLGFADNPLLMGILNVTPDSFSDGGCFVEPEAAIEHALRQVDDGAVLIDVGGESTRPGAEPVPAGLEMQRVLPVIRGIVARRPGTLVSVDTYKAEVARAAVDAGAAVINDVGGGLWDPEMPGVVRETGAGFICMHSRGRPGVMQNDPRYADVVQEVRAFLLGRKQALTDAGIPVERLLFDPGVGFGKTAGQNLELIAHAAQFAALERPVLWGLSRKSFIFKTLGLSPQDTRLPGGLAAHAALLQAGGPQIWRVHDVAETRQFITMWQAVHRARDNGTKGRPHEDA
jgi:dihydropteroate synthase